MLCDSIQLNVLDRWSVSAFSWDPHQQSNQSSVNSICSLWYSDTTESTGYVEGYGVWHHPHEDLFSRTNYFGTVTSLRLSVWGISLAVLCSQKKQDKSILASLITLLSCISKVMETAVNNAAMLQSHTNSPQTDTWNCWCWYTKKDTKRCSISVAQTASLGIMDRQCPSLK